MAKQNSSSSKQNISIESLLEILITKSYINFSGGFNDGFLSISFTKKANKNSIRADSITVNIYSDLKYDLLFSVKKSFYEIDKRKFEKISASELFEILKELPDVK